MKRMLSAVISLLCMAASTTPAFAARFTQGVISAPSTQFYFDYTLTPPSTLFSPGSSFEITTNVCDYDTQIGYYCGLDTLTFYSELAGGGFSRLHGYLVGQGEPGRYFSSAMYTGDEQAPVFLPGSYAVSTGAGEGTFTISRATSAVPETGTWAMMVVGFGGVGVAIRKRKRLHLATSA